jgi:hypothetical protein
LLISDMSLLTAGTRIFKHYMAYPGRWDADIFESWRSKANQLFAATMK